MPFRKIRQHRSSPVPLFKKKSMLEHWTEAFFLLLSNSRWKGPVTAHNILAGGSRGWWTQDTYLGQCPWKEHLPRPLAFCLCETGEADASGEYQSAAQDSCCYPFGLRPQFYFAVSLRRYFPRHDLFTNSGVFFFLLVVDFSFFLRGSQVFV